jgi:RNA polymerase sigma-54 factor
MALESRLELKLSQKLVLTPQLQMAIKLLQMPQLELSQTINQELTENPFLEEMSDVTSSEELSQEEESFEEHPVY